MTNGEPPYEPYQPAPAWDQPAYAPVQRTKWPMVIGVICIVIGSLGLLCYGCQSGLTVLLAAAGSNLPPELQNARPPQSILVGNIGHYCLSFVLSLWLLLGGIALAMRRAGARPALMAWSVCKIIVVIASIIYFIIFLSEMVQHMNQQQQGPFPMKMTEPIMLMTLLAQGVTFLIWPVFLLIWFLVPRFKNEVESWRSTPNDSQHPMVYEDAPQQWM